MPPKVRQASNKRSAPKVVKVPKKIPPWVAAFNVYVKGQDPSAKVHQVVDTHAELLSQHWAAFVEQAHEAQANRPAKKRDVDPFKSMGKAMEKVAAQVDEAKNDRGLLQQYQDRIKEVVPDQIKPALSAAVGGHPLDLAKLLQRATDDLNVLSQTTQRVISYANVDREDAHQAVHSLTQVSQSFETLRDSIESV